MDISLKLFSVSQIREIEHHIIQHIGISEYDLMFNAGKAVFTVLQNDQKLSNRPLVVICGSGNNGGDGYIVAGLAAKNNLPVICLEVGNFSKQTKTATKAKKFALRHRVIIIPYRQDFHFSDDCVIIDALFGIGIKGEVRAAEKEVICHINKARLANAISVIAVDVPSGIDADNGIVLGEAVIADLTVTFLGHKTGLFLGEAKRYVGRIEFSNLNADYNNFLTQLEPQYYLLTIDQIPQLIVPRNISAHKGNFGNILVIGGDYEMGGAAIMAAEAAYRAGAGRVTVLTRREHHLPLLARLPNAMTAEWNEDDNLDAILKDKTVLVIGPGLGQSDWSQQLFDLVMASKLPKVIDADALNLLSQSNKQYHLDNAIVTPHPKEAARLLETDVITIQSDRSLAAHCLFEKYQATVILKGNSSLIYGQEKKLYLCPYGNPAMAVAGMGDVLSGIVAGLLGQNLSFKNAAILATTIHAYAGDLAIAEQGRIGLIPTDLMRYITKLL